MVSVTYHNVLAWLCLCLALSMGGCNLGFDSSAYEYEPADLDASDVPDVDDDMPDVDDDVDPNTLPGCVDNDNDQFGVGADCVKDQRDCDDTKAFVNPAAAEECDDIDNDCDGMIDEDSAGQPLSRECYTGARVQLEREASACMPGRVLCAGGRYPSPVTADLCIGQVLPGGAEDEQPEKCDGLDNDCDGAVDPRCECPEEGAAEACYGGPPETRGKGACQDGERQCFRVDTGELRWGACEGARLPQPETCANAEVDDDCNDLLDDVIELGDPCDSGELGRCMAGMIECREGDAYCRRNLGPVDEVCNELDLDCDGNPTNGVANACGGCIPLTEVPGQTCGICDDGNWRCEGPDTISCLGASTLNACGECGRLDNQPGEECGVCGEYECEQEGQGVFCNDPGLNACDVCGRVRDGELLGTQCGECGTFECNGLGDGVVCRELEPNACNGCAELEGDPGATCGVCMRGTFQCEGENAVECTGDPGLNACGGCNQLGSPPGSQCGECGAVRCVEDDPGAVFCDDAGFNTCGGCVTLLHEPGEGCGVCGGYVCQNGTTVCADPGLNSCGGCVALPGVMGQRCGDCGTWTCDGQDAMHCEDPGFNACNGCGELVAPPLSDCGQCGQYKCSLDRTRVLCDDPGLNECEACGDVQGPPLGDSCGICGEYVCGGDNSSVCDDPGLNSCLECGTLVNAPGALCGQNGCGTYVCDEVNGTVCNLRACPTQPTAFRVFTALDGPTTDWQLDGQELLRDRVAVSGTVYIRSTPGTHRISIFAAGMEFAPEALLFDYDFTLGDGENATIVWAGATDGEYGAEDMRFLSDDPSRAENQVRVRWFHGYHGVNGGAVKVDVRRDGVLTNLYPSVPFGEATAWTVIPPGEYQIIVTPVLGGLPVANFAVGPTTTWQGGQVRTLLHGGRVGGVNTAYFLNDGEERYFP